jgi:hypothetical protein
MPLGNFTRRGGGGDRPTDPQAIFDRLTLRGSVENLWGPQTAALAEMEPAQNHRRHHHRNAHGRREDTGRSPGGTSHYQRGARTCPLTSPRKTNLRSPLPRYYV